MKTVQNNIFSENLHDKIEIDEKKAIEIAQKLLAFYLNEKEIFENSCLVNWDFSTLSFDILYCDSEKSHQINLEYRQKDYPADIITFAIFADSEVKFVFDGEINLGEIIISLDKIEEKAKEQNAKCKMQNIIADENEVIQDAPLTPNPSPARGEGEIEKSNPSTLQPFNPSTFEDELYFLISHGIMHLLGFDHQTEEDYNFIIKAQTSALKKVMGER